MGYQAEREDDSHYMEAGGLWGHGGAAPPCFWTWAAWGSQVDIGFLTILFLRAATPFVTRATVANRGPVLVLPCTAACLGPKLTPLRV